jgi:hypothetical protein
MVSDCSERKKFFLKKKKKLREIGIDTDVVWMNIEDI